MSKAPSKVSSEVHQFGGVLQAWGVNQAAKLKQSKLPTTSIVLPQYQPRQNFNERKLEELQKSIAQYGIIEPLIVRPLDDGNYELVAGERRLRAAKNLDLKEVPVTIHELNATQALQVALIENLQREDLSPIEEAKGILNLLAIELDIDVEQVKSLLYQMQNQTLESTSNVTSRVEKVNQVFAQLGKMTWLTFITSRLSLLNLPEKLICAIEQGDIEYTKAKAIAQVKDEEQQSELLTEAIAQNMALSQIRERVKELKASDKVKKAAPQTYPQRAKSLYENMKKRKIWEDPNKKEEFEELLAKLESLLQ
ncbi:ParB/RepB/Spo0J family partition protein [Brasilonema sp. CT11]|nr:ParB/RepB/Spo0J family partition protein [Brasilonema sp. CT11]